MCKKFEAKLEEFAGENDHIYLLVTYPQKSIYIQTGQQLKRCLITNDLEKKGENNFDSLPYELLGKIYGFLDSPAEQVNTDQANWARFCKIFNEIHKDAIIGTDRLLRVC